MNRNDIESGLRAVVEKYGPFTAQNMKLAEGVYTINEKTNYDHFKLNRIKQLVADLGYLRPGVRLLDIASLKSMFSIELSLEGLDVVSVEGREANIERGKYAARALGADRVEFQKDDVNNICTERYGQFDVVLCMGILYHIAKDKYLGFLKNIASCCTGVMIIDSFISLHQDEYVEQDGKRFLGTTWREFESDVSKEQREKSTHSSLNNDLSFSMTKPALVECLGMLGFTTVCEVLTPRQPGQPEDRPTLACFKGKSHSLRVFPEFDYHRDYSLATDTRGMQGQNLVHWNLPRTAAKQPPPAQI